MVDSENSIIMGHPDPVYGILRIMWNTPLLPGKFAPYHLWYILYNIEHALMAHTLVVRYIDTVYSPTKHLKQFVI